MQKNDILNQSEKNMNKSIDSLQKELGRMRAGHASANLLDRVLVNYYGVSTPLNQLASITIPESRVLMVSPYDKTTLKDIERALLESDLGINPNNDGENIRLVIPQLTGERRKELAKEVKKISESNKETIRHIRHEGIDKFRKQQKEGIISEDDFYDLEKQMQKITDKANKLIDKIVENKQKEILSE